mgnify:CR=1 FL=1
MVLTFILNARTGIVRHGLVYYTISQSGLAVALFVVLPIVGLAIGGVIAWVVLKQVSKRKSAQKLDDTETGIVRHGLVYYTISQFICQVLKDYCPKFFPTPRHVERLSSCFCHSEPAEESEMFRLRST